MPVSEVTVSDSEARRLPQARRRSEALLPALLGQQLLALRRFLLQPLRLRRVGLLLGGALHLRARACRLPAGSVSGVRRRARLRFSRV